MGALWVQCIKDNMARNDASAPAQFKWYPLMEFANWLPITYLNLPAEEKTPVEGSCLLFSLLNQIQVTEIKCVQTLSVV